MPKIEGGYILLSKKIVNNEIMQKPPEYLKAWLYLLSNANYKDDVPKKNLKKGQGVVNINELREFLSYYVGYRLEKPSRKKVWAIVEWLRNPNEGNNEGDNEGTMMETTKVTHGMVYKVLNYAFYQNPKNYEGNNESTTKETTNAQRREYEGNNKYNESKELNESNELKEDISAQETIPFAEIIDYLNEKAEKSFKPTTQKTKDLIKARFNEGFDIDDFKKVIDTMSKEWLRDKKMSQYLRPQTLFGTKFEAYLNAGGKTEKEYEDNDRYGSTWV